MKKRLLMLVPTLLVITAPAFAQSVQTKWAPLPMDLPKQVLSAIPTGPKNPADILHISINMPFRDPVGMKSFLDSVSNPKSANYRHFLTPDQVGARFGQTTANVAKITQYLTDQGFKIKLAARSHITILADATVAQAEAAFNTTLEQYTIPIPGTIKTETHFAYNTTPSLPAEISKNVFYIGGIENFLKVSRAGYLTPAQLASMYSGTPLQTGGNWGQGRTVAISNFDGYRLTNIEPFLAQFGLPTPAAGPGTNVTVVPIDGMDGSTHSQYGEGDLDIQCILGMAPLTNLIIYDDATLNDNPGDLDPLAVLVKEADDNLADIITESYGFAGTSAGYSAGYNLHLQMAAQGITYMCASGDSGTSWIRNSPYPDFYPDVLVIGGTTAAVNPDGTRNSEVAWDGSGGGWIPTTDSFNVLPSWQTGPSVPTNIPYRLIPDIAFDADSNTGYVIYFNTGFQVAGGTSCASPTCAGLLADSEQAIITGGGLPADANGNHRFGRIQDLLYSMNATSVNSAVFTDITSGPSNGTLPDGTTSNPGVGWDFTTGWGPIVFSGLVSTVLGLPSVTNLSLRPSTVYGANACTVIVTLSGPAPAGGLLLKISSSNPLAEVPPSITIPEGDSSAFFGFNVAATTSPTTATISAATIFIPTSAVLTINPLVVSSFTVSPSTVLGGTTSRGTVTLNGPTSLDGAIVKFTSSDPHAIPPTQNTIPGRGSVATFNITTLAVTSTTIATLTATCAGTSASTTLTLNPPLPTVASFTVSPTSVVGGVSSRGLVTLTGPAQTGGAVVKFTSNDPHAVPPVLNTIPLGGTTASFNITTLAATSPVSAVLSATYNGSSQSATLVVNPPAPTVQSFTTSALTVTGGTSCRGLVTLTGPAQTGGAIVKLTSDNSSAIPPSQNTIPAGGTTANFTINTLSVGSTTTATLTATYNSSSQSATLTINP